MSAPHFSVAPSYNAEGLLSKIALRLRHLVDSCFGGCVPTPRTPPIGRLPNEMLIEIFQFCLVSKRKKFTSDNMSSYVTVCPYVRDTPLVLAHVCRTWSQIIRSYPQFWSTLAIHNPRKRIRLLLSLWLVCAETQPLSITIRQGSKGYGGRQSATDAILRLLIKRCHLWRSLDIWLLDFQQSLMDIPLGSLEMLEDARIILPGFDSGDQGHVSAIIHSSPRLENVRWRGPIHYFSPKAGSQLKVMNCSIPVPVNRLLYVLQYCPMLEALILSKGVIDSNSNQLDVPFPPKTLLSLKSLRRLHIRSFYQSTAIILDNLVAPQLISLALTSIEPAPHSLQAFHWFMLRSSFYLQSFELESSDIGLADLLEWLELPAMSSVTAARFSRALGLDFSDAGANREGTYIESVIAKIKGRVAQDAYA